MYVFFTLLCYKRKCSSKANLRPVLESLDAEKDFGIFIFLPGIRNKEVIRVRKREEKTSFVKKKIF